MNRTYEPIKLPYGFHWDLDLTALVHMGDDVKRNDISRTARKRLRWIDHYNQHRNVALTCRYFGISRKTFYVWYNRFNPRNLSTLESRSRRPRRVRQWEVNRKQELRIISLRKKHIRWGKEKLKRIYEKEHGETVSSWKIQRVIEKHNLYYNPTKTIKARKKRRSNKVKNRITTLKRMKKNGFLIAFDGITIYWAGLKRYILTGIDVHSKLAFARMYPSKHSKHAADFVKRMHYLVDGRIENIVTDNGTEFEKDFRDAIEKLKLTRYYTRPRTPTDNAVDERFNRTVQEEFLEMYPFNTNPDIFNPYITNWLIEYNFERPHQSLDYLTPIEFHYKHYNKVLPMWSSSKYLTIYYTA